MTLQVLLDDTKREGYTEGNLERLIHQVCRKLQKGKKISDIADELEETEDVIINIVTVIEQCGTDCDEQMICKKLLESQQEK